MNCKFNVKLFPDNKQKNRRLTPQELETELYIAKWMKRPPRTMLLDPPFYPWLPPEPRVNFDLKFKE